MSTTSRNIFAKPRRIIGGHIVGLISGSLCAMIPHSYTLASTSVIAFAVEISICLMVDIDVNNHLASITVLGVSLTEFIPGAMIVVLTSSIILSLAYIFSKKFLKDLT